MPPKPKPLAERFHRYVQRSDDLFSCWLWTGKQQHRKWPYGKIGEGGKYGKQLFAHRVAWELTHGPIPDGLFVLHACDTPNCVRPDHLFLGTPRDNIQDMMTKGRCATLGEQQANVKLTETLVREIRQSAEPVTILAKRLGVSHPTISDVRRRRTWKHVA